MIEGVSGLKGRLGEGKRLVPVVPYRGIKVPEYLFEERGTAHEGAALPHRLGFGGPLGGEVLGAHGLASTLVDSDRVFVRLGFDWRPLPRRAPGVLSIVRIECVEERVPAHIVRAELAHYLAGKSGL